MTEALNPIATMLIDDYVTRAADYTKRANAFRATKDGAPVEVNTDGKILAHFTKAALSDDVRNAVSDEVSSIKGTIDTLYDHAGAYGVAAFLNRLEEVKAYGMTILARELETEQDAHRTIMSTAVDTAAGLVELRGKVADMLASFLAYCKSSDIDPTPFLSGDDTYTTVNAAGNIVASLPKIRGANESDESTDKVVKVAASKRLAFRYNGAEISFNADGTYRKALRALREVHPGYGVRFAMAAVELSGGKFSKGGWTIDVGRDFRGDTEGILEGYLTEVK